MNNLRLMLDLSTTLDPAEVRARFEQFTDPAIMVSRMSVICVEERGVQEALGREDAVKLVSDEILMFCAPSLSWTRVIREDGSEELDLEGGIHIEISERGERRQTASA